MNYRQQLSVARKMSLVLWMGIALVAQSFAQSGQVQGSGSGRMVIVVGVDGLSVDAFRQQSRIPHLRRLMEEGAWTLKARGVFPTSSSSNWASMIMGAGPEHHGVTSNKWEPDKLEIPPACTSAGTGDHFPTIFGVLRAQRPGTKIGVFHDWKGFGRLVEKGAADSVVHAEGPRATTQAAIAWWKANSPALLFVHLDHVDHAGHDHGWKSPEYDGAVEEADGYIGQILEAVKESGRAPETTILVTSDHGGTGTSHGNNTWGELQIPWILAGAGAAKGRELQAAVYTYDTAATVAHLFGVKTPDCWIGRPAREALQP
jgi:predicted AlkP superfamily pyrophosphatase or phosphodiesterase